MGWQIVSEQIIPNFLAHDGGGTGMRGVKDFTV
jgi:hypothetical protein